MKVIRHIGLGIFFLGFGIFIATFFLSTFKMTEETLKKGVNYKPHHEVVASVTDSMLGKTYESKFEFIHDFRTSIKSINEGNRKKAKQLSEKVEEKKKEGVDQAEVDKLTKEKDAQWSSVINNSDITKYTYLTMLPSTQGVVADNQGLFLFLTFGLCIIGSLIFIIPRVKTNTPAGVKNNHIWHMSLTSRGIAGFALGSLLIGFYICLYWAPVYITDWILIVEPIKKIFDADGNSSQWFLYGVLYTVAIAVMGIRAIVKYRHNKYQMIRSASLIFFQVAFAFVLVEILATLTAPSINPDNFGEQVALPSVDLKNMWPLDYNFFHEYRTSEYTATNIGLTMFYWGIALFLIGVPVITYFFGKRWYCSWICGCGGLAETAGDPFRQLSSKKLYAWRIERILVHSVLVFAVVMTLAVLYSYLPKVGDAPIVNRQNMVFAAAAAILIGGIVVFIKNRKETSLPRSAFYGMLSIGAVIIAIMLFNHFTGNSNLFFVDNQTVKSWYGFYIGAAFAGVVGTGFYPIFGNRPWCRFGCPLAAYLGLVQRFKSKFRITTNGGQCISCGNCSTYCEMGIDVRAYAQRGQNIVRSSCVGCGICSDVCPRGVLNLENGPSDQESRLNENPIIIGHKETKIVQ